MKRVKICPVCGSVNIGTGTFSDFCKDCGYGSASMRVVSPIIFPEIDLTKIKEFREKLKEAKNPHPETEKRKA